MNPVATLPDAQTAYDNLFANVKAEVFFRKCAAAGHYPSNEEEARAMMEIGARGRSLQQKQATDTESPILSMKSAFDRQFGNDPRQHAQAHELAVKQAADYFFENPDLYNSVLSLKAAEAEAIRQQLLVA